MSFQDVGKSKRGTFATGSNSTTTTASTSTATTSHVSLGSFATASAAFPLSSVALPSSAPSSGGFNSSTSLVATTTTTTTTTSGAASQQLSDGILQYQRHVGILEKIVRQIGSKADGPELESQFQLQVEVLQQLTYKLESLFREEERSFDQLPRTEAARRRATYVKLQRDYQRVQAVAKNYMLEERTRRSQQQQQQQQQRMASGANATAAAAAAASSSFFATTTPMDPEQQIQLQLQMQQDRLAEEIMREREEEIRNINRGMHQVNEIYKDLAHIVGEQQSAIDQIETDMQDARANAESGLKHVEKANSKFSGNEASSSAAMPSASPVTAAAAAASQCVIS